MVQMTLAMSLPVALGEGSEPLSQGDWNVTYHCQDTHVFIAGLEQISVTTRHFFCTFPFGYFFSTYTLMHFDYAY